MASISSHFLISLCYNSPTLFLDTLYHDLLSAKKSNFSSLMKLSYFLSLPPEGNTYCSMTVLPGHIYTWFLLKFWFKNTLLHKFFLSTNHMFIFCMAYHWLIQLTLYNQHLYIYIILIVIFTVVSFGNSLWPDFSLVCMSLYGLLRNSIYQSHLWDNIMTGREHWPWSSSPGL